MRAASLPALALAATTAAAYDWLQFGGDAQHSGNNVRESILHRNNVGWLGLKWQVTLPSVADGPPVFLEAVTTAGGVRDLLFVTTKAGHIVAIDAGTGTTVWSRQYAAGSCRINNGATLCYTTSSPAIDPNRSYVYSYGLDGYVHKHHVGDGVEVTGGGWPQLATKKGFDEKGSSALATASTGGTTYLYVVHGGYPGDNGDYQGHVTAIDLATGVQNVFNTMCSNVAAHLDSTGGALTCGSPRSAIWARPGVFYDAGTNRIFVSTGNGTYNGTGAGTNWSESILALNPNGTGAGGKPSDAYTPTNFAALDGADADLGSTGPAILPAPPASAVQHLAVQGGKDALLRLVNLANLSGQGAPGHTGGEIGAPIAMPQGGLLVTQPAVWVNPADGTTWVFVVNGIGASALRLAIGAGGIPSLVTQWTNAQGGTSPLVANNVLYYAGGGTLRAVDPLTGATLWSTSRVGAMHWQSPIVANGALYVNDESAQLTSFVLAGASMGVDTRAAAGTSSNLDAVLEPGESVVVEPTRRNVTAGAIAALSATASNFTGPAGANYTINDNTAGYGALAAGAAANCFTASGNCYRMSVTAPATRPAVHWDATFRETLSNGDVGTILLHVGHSFSDVADTDLMYRYIETLAHNRVTLGYAGGTFHPLESAMRGHSSMFVARGRAGPDGDGAIPATGAVGASAYNCVAAGTSLFLDVAPTDLWCKHIHYLASRNVNQSFQCTDPQHVCPTAPTTRAAMAVVVAGTVAGGDASVPAAGTYTDSGASRSFDCSAGGSSHFSDVATNDSFCRHVNYLWARGIVDGYADGTFLPGVQVTRGQMAKFITNGLRLSLYGQ